MSENGHEPESGNRPHRHSWELTGRAKSCHSWRSVYHCASCTARLVTYGEHSGRYDPTFPFADDCERCRALAGGAAPHYELEVL